MVVPSAEDGSGLSNGGIVRSVELRDVSLRYPSAVYLVFHLFAFRLMPIGVNIVAAPNPEVGIKCGCGRSDRLRQLVAVTGTEGDDFERLIKIIRELCVCDVDEANKGEKSS